MEKRNCVHCGVDISKKKLDAKFCSIKCYVKKANTWRALEIKDQECGFCKKVFRPKTRKSTSYCSIICMYKGRAEKMKVVWPKKSCQNCGGEFQPTRSYQIYCSYKCRCMVVNMATRMGINVSDINALEHVPNETGAEVQVSVPVVSLGDSGAVCVLCGVGEGVSNETLLCEPCDKKNMN